MGKTIATRKKLIDLMLIVGVVLLILWALGLITSYSMGGGIHVLAVIALVLFVVWFVSGRR
jgi:hypothetical protein